MKKSTALVIFIIYMVSIVLIGFFGMAVKAYDLQKYITSIEMDVEAEDKEMFKFEYLGIDLPRENDREYVASYNRIYKLTIYFDYALLDEEGQMYLPLTLIPKVTYDTGDVGAKGDTIKYSTNPEAEELIDAGNFTLDELGRLVIYKKKITFDIFVNPASVAKIGSGAMIQVSVR